MCFLNYLLRPSPAGIVKIEGDPTEDPTSCQARSGTGV